MIKSMGVFLLFARIVFEELLGLWMVVNGMIHKWGDGFGTVGAFWTAVEEELFDTVNLPRIGLLNDI